MFPKGSLFAAVLCAAATSVAQSYTNYTVVGSTPVPALYNGNVYAADLNNDGIPDLIVNEYSPDSGRQQPYFAVFIAKGDGTFYGPMWYPYSASSIPPGDTGPGAVPMAFGDFNGDGNVDIAMPVGNHTIGVYLGKGDGTLTNEWYSVLNLPSDEYVSFYPTMVAADLNHDGKIDLTVAAFKTDGSGETVYVLPGEGNGLFSEVIPVLNFANPGVGGSWGVDQVLTGDFDGDSNADLTVMTSTGDHNGGYGTMTQHVLYGDGAFAFEDTILNTSALGLSLLNVGDLNGDGKSDLFTAGLTYYGQADRTFASYTQQLPQAGYSISSAAIADLNNDGRNDFVAMATTYTSTFVVQFLATASPGQFEIQTWNVPDAIYGTPPPVVGDFNHDGKPDWAYIGQTTSSTTGTSSIAYTGLNATVGQLWSDCDYPAAGRDINLCSPALNSDGTVNFNATAHSFGDLRKMELWVDGKKLGEQYHTWEGNGYFNLSSSVAPGTHSGTYYAADFDNTLQRFDFDFTVTSSCSAPASAGVHLCAPTNGTSINSTSVLVQATSTVTGSLARMEIWVDSAKKYTETTSTSLSAAVMASPGTHTFTVFAVNTDGTVWSQQATATVQ